MMSMVVALVWLVPGPLAPQASGPDAPAGNVTTKEYLFAATTLANFRKDLNGAKDPALKTQLAPGSGLAGVYVTVKRVNDKIAEIKLYYSTVLSPKLEPLRETPFRPGDEDFEKLVKATRK